MLLNTKHFGEININEEQIITFVDGIPGFESLTKYSIIQTQEPDSAFCWMQSTENAELAFALVNPFMIKADYEFELTQEKLDMLNIRAPEEVVVYAIVVIPEDVSKASMNLKAPIIINSTTKKGAQIIIDNSKYEIRNFIMDEIQKQSNNKD